MSFCPNQGDDHDLCSWVAKPVMDGWSSTLSIYDSIFVGFSTRSIGHLVIITTLWPVLVSQVLLVSNYTKFSLFPHLHCKHVAFLGERVNLITVNKMELQVFLITPHLAPVWEVVWGGLLGKSILWGHPYWQSKLTISGIRSENIRKGNRTYACLSLSPSPLLGLVSYSYASVPQTSPC